VECSVFGMASVVFSVEMIVFGMASVAFNGNDSVWDGLCCLFLS